VSVVRLVAPAGVATGDASDRLLHSETVQARAPVLRRFPAQRPSRARPFGARSRVALVPEPRGSVPDHANVCFACCLARPETRAAGDGRLGAARRKRDRGEPRFTARFPLRRPVDRSRGRFLPPDADRSRSPLTPLSPPPCSQRGGRQANPTRRLGGRQDRFRAGLVKGARIAGPGCLPSSVATRIPSGPKRGRNHVAFARARRSRDEDRRTEANRPPFAAGGPLRLRAWVPPVVRLPFTRSV